MPTVAAFASVVVDGRELGTAVEAAGFAADGQAVFRLVLLR